MFGRKFSHTFIIMNTGGQTDVRIHAHIFNDISAFPGENQFWMAL